MNKQHHEQKAIEMALKASAAYQSGHFEQCKRYEQEAVNYEKAANA